MSRGKNTGPHPGRQVSRHRFDGSYGGIPTSMLDDGHAPFYGEGRDAHYESLLLSRRKEDAKKSLDHASGSAPFYGELADEYYASEAKAQGKSNLWPGNQK